MRSVAAHDSDQAILLGHVLHVRIKCNAVPRIADVLEQGRYLEVGPIRIEAGDGVLLPIAGDLVVHQSCLPESGGRRTRFGTGLATVGNSSEGNDQQNDWGANHQALYFLNPRILCYENTRPRMDYQINKVRDVQTQPRKPKLTIRPLVTPNTSLRRCFEIA